MVFPNKEKGLSQMTLIHCLSTRVASLLLIGTVVLLAACSTAGSATAPPTATAAFHTTLKTRDGQFVVQFSVTPNRLGLNVFNVGVEDASSGKPAPKMLAQLSTTMLDMDMGTDQVEMQPNGHGQYSATSGRSQWEVTGRFAFSCAHRTLLCMKPVWSSTRRHRRLADGATPWPDVSSRWWKRARCCKTLRKAFPKVGRAGMTHHRLR